MPSFPGPEDGRTDAAELFCGYLDFFRGVVEEKLAGLDEDQLRTSRLPSGWTPLELLVHLTHMERRWIRWGFQGEDVDAPWGDQGPDGRWRVPEGRAPAELLADLHEVGAETTRTIRRSGLGAVARPGGRFGAEPAPPTLGRICFHVLQEYARHAGHLDVVRELVDGTVGE